MKAICEGRKTRQEVVHETIEQYRAVYLRSQQRLDVLQRVSLSSRGRMTKTLADQPSVRP